MQQCPSLETGFREDHSAPLNTSKHKQMLLDHDLMNDNLSMVMLGRRGTGKLGQQLYQTPVNPWHVTCHLPEPACPYHCQIAAGSFQQEGECNVHIAI